MAKSKKPAPKWNKGALIAQIAKECWARGHEIDPNDELHWESLAVGWAIAKGLPPEEARQFGFDASGELAEDSF